MQHLSMLLKSLYGGAGGCSSSSSSNRRKLREEPGGREAVDALVKEAKKNDLILKSSGVVRSHGSNNFVSVFSKRGEKGINQDCSVVWEEFGCQKDMIFCGIFDGHGPWGHYVAKKVRESFPPSLLCNWQEATSRALLDGKQVCQFGISEQSYIRTCAAIDNELKNQRKMDCFNSGTTALMVVKQVPSFIEREHEFRFLAVVPESVDGTPYTAPAVVCARYSDEEYFRVRCKGSTETFFQRYGRYNIPKIWQDDILPCRVYLRHCVLAAKNLGEAAYDNFLDHTFLGDRKITIRQYLASTGSGIMEEEPPEALKSRYGG